MAGLQDNCKCIGCLDRKPRSKAAKYCAECHIEAVKRNRRESAERKRRDAGILPLKGSFVRCVSCELDVPRGSMSQLYCKPCAAKSAAISSSIAKREYEKRNPRKRDKPTDKERQKRWAEKNRDKLLSRSRAYNEKNREDINRKSRERLARPETKEKRREIDRRYRSHPKQRVDQRMKTGIRIALAGKKAGRSWEKLVGYSLDDLIQHLERQFTKGMSWDNIGEWHIDHIRPKVSYDYNTADDPEFRACWALSNLRPLWSLENRQKHARMTYLL